MTMCAASDRTVPDSTDRRSDHHAARPGPAACRRSWSCGGPIRRPLRYFPRSCRGQEPGSGSRPAVDSDATRGWDRRRRTDPARTGRAAFRARGPYRRRRGARPRRSPSARPVAPRRQTGQPHGAGTAGAAGAGLRHRLRNRAGGSRNDRSDRDRDSAGHSRLRRAGATRRWRGRLPSGHLRTGLHALRNADRGKTFPESRRRRGDTGTYSRPAAPRGDRESGPAAGDRRGDSAGDGERPGSTLSELRSTRGCGGECTRCQRRCGPTWGSTS